MLYLTRGVALHDSTSCSREDFLDECGRPCDTLSCLLLYELWLRCNQSILVQETQSAKLFDLTCFKTFPITAVTCSQVGPMSLDSPVDTFARSDCSRSSLSPEVLSDDQQRGALPASTRSRWRQAQGGMDVAPSFPKACDVLLGTPGALLDLFSPDKGIENSNSNISKNSWTTTTSLVYRKCMERTSFFKLSRCWLRDFDSMVHFFLIMKMREDRLSAFAGIFFFLKRQL